MNHLQSYKDNLIEKIESEKGRLKTEYSKIRELAELCGDTGFYIDSPEIKDKVTQIIPENEISKFRGMNHDQLNGLADSFQSQFKGLSKCLEIIYNE